MPSSQIQFYCEYLRTDLLHGLPLLKFKRQVHRSMLSYLCNLCLPTASFSIPAYSHPSPQRLIRSFSPVNTSVLTSCTVLHQGLEAGPGVTHMSNATSFILVHSTIQLLVQSVSLHRKLSEFFPVFSDPAHERLWNASLPPVNRMPLHPNSKLCHA